MLIKNGGGSMFFLQQEYQQILAPVLNVDTVLQKAVKKAIIKTGIAK